MNIGNKLKEEREKKGLSQPALSDLCGWGYKQARISHYETGRRAMQPEDMIVVENALELHRGALLGAESPGNVNIIESTVPILTAMQAQAFLSDKTLPNDCKYMPELMPGSGHVAFGFTEESKQFEPAILKGAIYYILPMAAMMLSKMPDRLLAAWVNKHIIVGRMKPLAMGQIALLMPDKTEVILESGMDQVIGLVTNIHNP